MNKDTGYPATLAECREAAKLCTYQGRMEFASHTEIPLLDESGAPEWSFIQGLPNIKVNEVSYLLSIFGGNLSLGPRFDRITRTIQALQADGQIPSDDQHIAIAKFAEIAEVAGVVLPEQWQLKCRPMGRPGLSVDAHRDVKRYEELLSAAKIMYVCGGFELPLKRSDVIEYMRLERAKDQSLYLYCCGRFGPSNDTALGDAIRRGGMYLGRPPGDRCPVKSQAYLVNPDISHDDKQ